MNPLLTLGRLFGYVASVRILVICVENCCFVDICVYCVTHTEYAHSAQHIIASQFELYITGLFH